MTTQSHQSPTFHVASDYAFDEMWRHFRSVGYRIISTWIDDYGSGVTVDLAGLAFRRIADVTKAEVCILFPAYSWVHSISMADVGAALAAGREVRCVGEPYAVPREFLDHPRFFRFNSISDALNATNETSYKPIE